MWKITSDVDYQQQQQQQKYVFVWSDVFGDAIITCRVT